MSEPRGKVSSGIVLYRRVGAEIEVLLVHPAGAYNRRSPWGIPKGQPNPDEDLEQTARRETWEETGITVGPLWDIGFVDYTRSKNRVHGYAGPAPCGEQPARASHEVDKAEFIELSRARRIIHPDQGALLDRLVRFFAEAPDAVEAAERAVAGTDASATILQIPAPPMTGT